MNNKGFVFFTVVLITLVAGTVVVGGHYVISHVAPALLK